MAKTNACEHAGDERKKPERAFFKQISCLSAYGHRRYHFGILLIILVVFYCIVTSCVGPGLDDAEQLESIHIDRIHDMIEELTRPERFQARDRVVIIEQVVERMKAQKRSDLIPPFLGLFIQNASDDSYKSYYLFLIATAYESMGSGMLAASYFHRSLHTASDVVVQGSSVHFMSIEKLLIYTSDPEVRINLYNDLLTNYTDRIDRGRTYYYLGRAYEDAGRYPEAFAVYSKFLDYPDADIPGRVDEHQRVRELLAMAGSGRDWTRQDLDTLIQEIKTALAQKDADKLLSLQAKVNFFSMSWLQEKADFNSQVNYDLRRFVQSSNRIFTENDLEANSNSQEAYLKSWGWSTYIPTWYLYFRRVNFPADPEIHGNWEWVGIFFGDSLQ